MTDVMTIARVSVAEVKAGLEAGKVQVVDLRPSFDFAGGRIPGSTSLPYRALASRPDQLDRDRRILLVSEDGSQCDEAAKIAMSLGFTNIASVDGGYDAWVEAGYPIHTIDDGT